MLMPTEEVTQLVDTLSREADIREYLRERPIVVTGAGGFLGRWLVPVLAKLGARVYALESSDVGVRSLQALGLASVEVVPINLLGSWSPSQVVWPGVMLDRLGDLSSGHIIHMAGIASPQQYQARPLDTLALSYEVSKTTLELAHATGSRYLFFSSSEIYGDPEPNAIPTPETYVGRVSSMGNRACYDEGKRVGEALASIYARRYGEGGCHVQALHTNVVRPFNVYGPGMLPTDFRVLPNFALAVLNGQPMRVYGSGGQTRTYCYVTDFVDGVVRLLVRGRPGLAYNVGNDSPEISVLGLAGQVHVAALTLPNGPEIRPCEVVPHPSSYPSDEPSRRCPDLTRAREHLGYAPRVGLQDGLRRFLAWAREEKSYRAAS